jgi:hypothetical protein
MVPPPCCDVPYFGGSFDALVVVLEDDVDDAADRIGAVDRGCAVLQHLDLLNGIQR